MKSLVAAASGQKVKKYVMYYLLHAEKHYYKLGFNILFVGILILYN